MMQLSHDFFYLWVTDRIWMQQRHRMCNQFPQLAGIFNEYANNAAEHLCKRAIKSNSNKKRKSAWITPRKGIWYVFKRWLSLGFTRAGFFKLYRNTRLHPIALSVVLATIPYALHVKTHSMKNLYTRRFNRVFCSDDHATVRMTFSGGVLTFAAYLFGEAEVTFVNNVDGMPGVLILGTKEFYDTWRATVLGSDAFKRHADWISREEQMKSIL
jgi:hypothetical protein